MLQRLGRFLTRLGPERLGPALPMLRALNRGYRRIQCAYTGIGDRAYVRRTGDTMMSLAHLRYRVHGLPDTDSVPFHLTIRFRPRTAAPDQTTLMRRPRSAAP